MRKILAVTLGIAVAGAMGATYLASGSSAPPLAMAANAAGASEPVTIWRSPGCGCCDAYADYLRAEGFEVTVLDDRDFVKTSVSVGVPKQGVGCHLSKIGTYFVSGLVPSEIIERLLEERPEITGITLPGMPANAPGMAATKTGTLKVYSFGPDGVGVYSDE